MNFYKKTNFYPLLLILFLACPLNSMWFKKLPKVKFPKAKVFMSLAAIVATIKIKKSEYSNELDLQKISVDEQAGGKIEISQINCPSDALLANLHDQGKEVCIFSCEKSEQVTKIIKKTLEKEREMAEDYYVFYHGQTGSHKVLQDLTTELMAEESPEKFSNFIALRDPKNFQAVQSAQHFLDQNNPNFSFRDDQDKKIRKHLLSVNLSLFGNIHWSGRNAGECSADYFFRNISAYEKSSKELLESFLFNHNFPKNYLQQIILMQEDIARHGNLIQICIPKKGIDFYAYTSQPLGRPTGIPLSTILARYPNQNDFNKIYCLQARIVLSSGVLDPKSGVKMYQYSLADEKALSSYDKKLKTLVSEIVRPKTFKEEKEAVQAKYAYLKDEIDAEYAEWQKSRAAKN